jgi:Domain of unknown function (DUF5664)
MSLIEKCGGAWHLLDGTPDCPGSTDGWHSCGKLARDWHTHTCRHCGATESGMTVRTPTTDQQPEGRPSKLRMDLIPPWFLESLAEALTIGADKHGDGLHSSAPTEADCDGAIMRHHSRWRMGETHAGDDGQHHGAAMVARILQRMDLERKGNE